MCSIALTSYFGHFLPLVGSEIAQNLKMNQGIKKTMLTELKIFLLCFFRRLQSIEKERAPQVLAIRYSDEEEGEDDDEEEGFGGVRSEESSDEESEEERHGDSLDTASPDSSFLSLSPGEHLLTDQT